MKLGDLNPNPKNPRKIDDEELTMLKGSLEKFGDLSGFVFNKQSNQLISGHQRSKVLPPDSEIVITETYPTPNQFGTTAIGYVLVNGEKHKYREVSVDEKIERAMNVAANQNGGNFDLEILPDFIKDLPDLDILGFKKHELEDLLAPLPEIKLEEKEEKEKTPNPHKCPSCGFEYTA